MPEGLWGTVGGWFSRNAQAYLLASIPLEDGEASPLKPYESYLRVWLADMFLAKRGNWLRSWFPAVHAEIRMPFGGERTVTFTRVARPRDDALAEGVLLNYAVTDLIPYNGGTVEIDTALFGLKNDDNLAAGVALLQSFSNLVAPPLGQALAVAEKVATGARNFLDQTGGDVHLALHQTLVSDGGGGGNVLRPGYLAVVLATQNEVPPADLRVQGDRLHRITDDGNRLEPFTSHDYMLLRIEGRAERDDWEQFLPEVVDARNRAAEAFLRADEKLAGEYRSAALMAVFNSSDLVYPDKRRIVGAIEKQWKDLAKTGLGAVPADLPADLSEMLARYPMSREVAAARGPLTAEEVFSG